jgi:hypothetical protein
MGVPTSEVGYAFAMPRREDHEVHKGHVVALKRKTLRTELSRYRYGRESLLCFQSTFTDAWIILNISLCFFIQSF